MGAPLLSWICGGVGIFLLILNRQDDND